MEHMGDGWEKFRGSFPSVCGRNCAGSCLASGGCNPNGKDRVEFFFENMVIIQILGAIFFFGGGVTGVTV